MTPVTHIVPRFPPQIDGLGDYCRLLVDHLERLHGIPARILVGDPSWRSAGSSGDVAALSRRDAAELLEKLGLAETVVLHYVCYGYHHRGVPFWINRALKAWKQSNPRRRLIVVFHELWASGPPWKSEFYFSLFQRHLVRELHRLCDAAMTSVPVMFRMLEAIAPGKTTFQPIPSNLPQIVPAPTKAPGSPVTVIAFGQAASRLKGLQTHAPLLRALHAGGLLKGLRVVGKGVTGGSTPSEDVRFARTFLPEGFVAAEKDVTPQRGAELLAGSDLFLSYYPSMFLCKSGALMAALANSCVPVLPETKHAEPLADGRELLACDGSPAALARIVDLARNGGLAAIADAGRAWHDATATWPIVAGKAQALLRSTSSFS